MTKTKNKKLVLLFRLALMAAVAVVLTCTGFGSGNKQASALTSSTINFQARLLTAAGATVPDGNYNVEFKIYNSLTSSGSSQGSCTGDANCEWTETRTSTNHVRVVNGYLTVNLGSVTGFGNINWDQEQWLTMNIGGTAVSPTWDGEMTPRLKLTAVPYAFRAGQLANTNGANTSTLSWATQTASNSILLPNEAGTLCIQSSANCGFLTTGGAAGSYVQLQASTPGTAQTGNLNISGVGIFGTSLQSPATYSNTLDTISGTTTLNIGTTNATSGINLNQNVTVASGKSLTVQGALTQSGGAITLTGNAASSVSTSSGNLTLQAGSGIVTLGTSTSLTASGALTVSSGGTNSAVSLASAGTGNVNLLTNSASAVIAAKSQTNSVTAFQVQNTGGTAILNVDTSNSRIGINNIAPGAGYALDVTGAINTSSALFVAGTSVCDTTGTTGCIAKSGSGFYIHNQTTVQASNLYVQAATTGSVAAKFQAFNGGSGDIADFLNGTGTTVASIGSAGSTLFKPSTDGTSAFQIQPSGSATPVFNVDTTNSRVGIGTATPGSTLTAAVSNTQVTAPIATFQQGSTGDATIELKNTNTGTSFYLSQDTSNSNGFAINSSTAATSSQATPTHVQSNSSGFFSSNAQTTAVTFSSANTASNFIAVAATWDLTNSSNITCTDTLGNTYTTAIVKLDAVPTQALGICYAPNIKSGSGNIVTVNYGTGSANVGSRFVSIHEYSGIATSNPVDVSTGNIGATGATGANGYTTTATTTTQDGDLIFASMFDDASTPGTVTAGTTPLTFSSHFSGSAGFLAEEAVQSTAGSISASFTNTVAHTYVSAMVAFKRGLSSGSLTDTNTNSLFSLSQTGGAKFQNITNSTNAFQIQNASGTQAFNVDTSLGRVTIGNGATGSATPTLLVLNNGTNATADPTGVPGAMYYSSAIGSFRCYNGGAWQNCIGGLISSNITTNTANTCTTACPSVSRALGAWMGGAYCTTGRVYHIFSSGTYSTTGTPTLSLGLYSGSNATTKTSDTSLGVSNTGTAGTGAVSLPWDMDIYIICGASNMTVHGSGSMVTSSATGATSALQFTNAAVTIPSTQTDLYLFPTWSASSASNTITGNQMMVQAM